MIAFPRLAKSTHRASIIIVIASIVLVLLIICYYLNEILLRIMPYRSAYVESLPGFSIPRQEINKAYFAELQYLLTSSYYYQSQGWVASNKPSFHIIVEMPCGVKTEVGFDSELNFIIVDERLYSTSELGIRRWLSFFVQNNFVKPNFLDYKPEYDGNKEKKPKKSKRTATSDG